MKITGIETYPVWGGERNLLIVVVDTDEGIYGVGEAGLTGRELAVMGTIEHFQPLLMGEDPFRTEHLWQLLSGRLLPCAARCFGGDLGCGHSAVGHQGEDLERSCLRAPRRASPRPGGLLPAQHRSRDGHIRPR